MNNLYKLVESLPETSDTPDICYQLANVNYRLDILITIILFLVIVGFAGGFCYIMYRFILRFI